MAIVDLDKGPSRRPPRGDRAVIAALGGAVALFGLAMWLGAPDPAAGPNAARPSPTQSAVDAPATTVIQSRATAPFVGARDAGAIAAGRPLALPAGSDNVDLFLVPERITNENLIWTMRSVVRIRGGVGLASVEGPAIVTWTEKGFQYWLVSPTRTTDELIKMADDLR